MGREVENPNLCFLHLLHLSGAVGGPKGAEMQKMQKMQKVQVCVFGPPYGPKRCRNAKDAKDAKSASLGLWAPLRPQKVQECKKCKKCKFVVLGYPRQDTTDVSADLQVLTGFEPINVDAVKRLAALKASARLHVEICGSIVPLRTALMHLVLRACKHLPYRGQPEASGVRQILTAWRQSGTFPVEVAGKLRRHSGVHEVESIDEKHQQMTQSLQDVGLSVYTATCSVFVAPRWFKHIARAGILGVDLDQSKSAVRAMLERHPGAEHLEAYIDDAAPYHRSLGGSQDERKSLFRAFLCGGGHGLLSKYEAEHRCHADQNVLGFWEGGKAPGAPPPPGAPQKPNLHFLHLLHLCICGCRAAKAVGPVMQWNQTPWVQGGSRGSVLHFVVSKLK